MHMFDFYLAAERVTVLIFFMMLHQINMIDGNTITSFSSVNSTQQRGGVTGQTGIQWPGSVFLWGESCQQLTEHLWYRRNKWKSSKMLVDPLLSKAQNGQLRGDIMRRRLVLFISCPNHRRQRTAMSSGVSYRVTLFLNRIHLSDFIILVH